MSIERIYHCDWRDCETHARTSTPGPPTTFFEIVEGGGDQALHFCSWDCILRNAAEKPPAETLQLASD